MVEAIHKDSFHFLCSLSHYLSVYSSYFCYPLLSFFFWSFYLSVCHYLSCSLTQPFSFFLLSLFIDSSCVIFSIFFFTQSLPVSLSPLSFSARSLLVSTIFFSILFVSFLYCGVCSDRLLSNFLFIYTSQCVQKSSNGDGKFPFYGWGNYFHRTSSTNLQFTI